MRAIAPFAIVLSSAVILALTGPALAQPAADLAACDKAEPDLAACERVISNPKQSKTNLATAYYMRGTAAYNKADYKAALADLNRAIALNSNLANAYYNRALTLRQFGEYDRGLADLNAYVRMQPDDHDAFLTRGNLQFDKRNFDLALVEYEKSLKLKPGCSGRTRQDLHGEG